MVEAHLKLNMDEEKPKNEEKTARESEGSENSDDIISKESLMNDEEPLKDSFEGKNAPKDDAPNAELEGRLDEGVKEISVNGSDNEIDDVKKELLEFAGIDSGSQVKDDDLEEELRENLGAEVKDEVENSEEGAENEVEGKDRQNVPFNPEIDAELEAKLEEELRKKKKKQKKEMTESDLIEYLSARRNKIQYHALWHLVFNVEDHAATKKGLYDALKEVTSKDPVEPIDEHKFYFGLGFILRLELNGKKIVKFKDGKLAIDVNVEKLKKILEIVGDPISERPIITEKEKKEMFEEFLKDDFLNDF